VSSRHRVAVIGLGFGLAHLAAYRGLAEQFEVVAVCDHDQGRLDGLATWFDVELRTTSFDDVLALDQLDVVDICTPPTTHLDMAAAALARDRHVICEKPVAGSLADVDRLADAEAASAGRLMPIFQYRFGDGAGRLRHLMDRDLVGPAHVASVETFWHRGGDYYDTSPWRGTLARELGGVCAMHAIHAYDLLLTLLGPARSVYARTATRLHPVETEDCAAVVVEFVSGALATLTATLGSARELSRMRIHFEHLSVESGSSPYGGSAEPWTIEPMTPDSAARIDAALAGYTEGGDLLTSQLAAFADALDTNERLPVTIADARPTIELLTAIYQSAAAGAAVELPVGSDHSGYAGWHAR